MAAPFPAARLRYTKCRGRTVHREIEEVVYFFENGHFCLILDLRENGSSNPPVNGGERLDLTWVGILSTGAGRKDQGSRGTDRRTQLSGKRTQGMRG